MDPRLQAVRGDAINRPGSVGSNALQFREMFRNTDSTGGGMTSSHNNPSPYGNPGMVSSFTRPATENGSEPAPVSPRASAYGFNTDSMQSSTPQQSYYTQGSAFTSSQGSSGSRGSDPGIPPVAGQSSPSQLATPQWTTLDGTNDNPSSAGEVLITDADISQLQTLQLQLPAAAISSGELRAGVILKLGGKKPFFQWQWRRCVVTISGKMQYYDPKKQKNSIRGELALKNATFESINEGHAQFARLKKFSDKMENNAISYFSVKPSNVAKTYFFAVPTAERDDWLKSLRTAEKAESLVREQQALQLKMQYARQQEYLKMQQQRQAKIGGSIERSASVPTGLPSHPSNGVQHATSLPALSQSASPSSASPHRPPSDPASAQFLASAAPSPSQSFLLLNGSTSATGEPQPSTRSPAGSAGSGSSASATPRAEDSTMSDLLAFSYSRAPEAGGDPRMSPRGPALPRTSVSRHTEPPHQVGPSVALPRRSVSAHPDLSMPDIAAAPLPLDDFTFDSPDDATASTAQPMPAGAVYESTLPMDVQVWTPTDLATFVYELGLGQYSQVFISQNISGWNVANFTTDDLSRYAGVPVPDAETILAAIQHRMRQFYGNSFFERSS